MGCQGGDDLARSDMPRAHDFVWQLARAEGRRRLSLSPADVASDLTAGGRPPSGVARRRLLTGFRLGLETRRLSRGRRGRTAGLAPPTPLSPQQRRPAAYPRIRNT